MRNLRTLPRELAISLLLVIFATCLTMALESYLGRNSLFIQLAAVVIAAFYCRTWIAIVTATFASMSHNFFQQFPRFSFQIAETRDLIELAVFLVIAIIVSLFGSRLRTTRQRAERATRDRENLLAIVSHDLKNPLSVIRTNADFLLKKQEHDGSVCGRSASMIRDAAARMERLIEDLMEYEKAKTTRFDVRPEMIDAAEILKCVEQAMDSTARAKELRIEYRRDRDDFQVLCDPVRILQVLTNIVGNAVKFSPRNSVITVSASYRHGWAVFRIEDRGPGIPASDLPYIFDEYWQARTTAHLGTGLGLAIAKGIMKAHHGRIQVWSDVGRGTTFELTLPQAAKAQPVRRVA